MLESIRGTLTIPYHEPRDGFWGEKTVTLNFCEEDYVISYYCAEVCNAATNLLFIWLGLRGIRNCLRYSHPTVFFVAFAGYMVVGTGSTAFHMTLKYPMQLVDELSMIYTTCLMVFATFSHGKSRAFSVCLTFVLLGLAGFITARYYHTKDPEFHQNAYAALTALVVISNMWIMERTVRPALTRRQERRASASNRATANKIVNQMWLMVATGLSIFLGGFLVWNLDNIYCRTLRSLRHEIQLPWAVLLEGHAWWHLMTGIGAYHYIIWRIWLRRCLDGKEDSFRLDWPSIFSLPDVVAVEEMPNIDSEKKYD